MITISASSAISVYIPIMNNRSKHYTAILLDGDMNIDYAHNYIIPDILNNVADKKFAALIKDITFNNNFDGKIDLVNLGIE